MADDNLTWEEGDVLVFNLAHDLFVKFTSDGLCTIQKMDDSGEQMSLDERAQLLLLDALCHAFSFTSPLASIITKQVIGGDEEEGVGTTDPAELPSLENAVEEDPLD